MAKKQNFIVGSTNPNTNTWTSSQLNNGWNKYQVLKSGDLDGVFNAVSDYSNDSSQEIWNAIRILKGSNPTGASTNELGNIINTVVGAKATKATDFITPLTSNNKGATKADLNTLREEIETSSLTFKGYVATSAPSSSTYGLVKGNIWINASAMPTTFPVAIAGIWNGTSWATTTDTYTVKDFDFFRNINDNEGYYWFGGQWTVMSTDMSTTYFSLNQTSGKWEIKSNVNLPGEPTTTTAATTDNSTKIATTAFVKNVLEGYVPTGGAANTDLDNLTSTGQNIGNWSSNVTNCITEIPQDIKLELNSTTFTLKAGSKIYVPDGFEEDGTTKKFNIITIESDIVSSGFASGHDYLLYVGKDNLLHGERTEWTYSHDEVPGYITHSGLNYSTSSNRVHYTATGNLWTSGQSLPIALFNYSSGGVLTITQIFNGFGYIGSTVFALPGIKALIPDGRNEDGTLKNIEITVPSVQTIMPPSLMTGKNNVLLMLKSNGKIYGETITVWGSIKYLKNLAEVSGLGAGGKTCWYCEEDNKIHLFESNNVESIISQVFVGNYNTDYSSPRPKITSLNTKQSLHVLDYNDTEYMAHQAMPSGRGIDLTLGSSGSSYTAPADGYIYLNKTASAVNQIITIINDDNGMRVSDTSVTASAWIATCLPVSKGQSIRITYTAGGTTNAFKFVYAQGVQ